nr:tetratricopeptide repeat protein 23-like isoform X2 [Aotus nancymaae]
MPTPVVGRVRGVEGTGKRRVRKKMRASPIRIPTASNDIDWDFCFPSSQQTEISAPQQTHELYPTGGSEESEEETKAKEEEEAIDCMSHPKEKLAESQKRVAQLIKEKMAKKHAASAKNTLLTWKANTTSDKEKEEILEALVMLYYTLGVAWLLQNRGREAYFNLQKAERNMKELKELYKGGVCELKVSEKDLTLALGRVSLAIHRLNLALAYFEKAIGDVIAAKSDRTSDLISLYEETAQIEQLRKNHNQAIQYLQQVGGLAGAQARSPCLAPGLVLRGREAWASQKNKGYN